MNIAHYTAKYKNLIVNFIIHKGYSPICVNLSFTVPNSLVARRQTRKKKKKGTPSIQSLLNNPPKGLQSRLTS